MMERYQQRGVSAAKEDVHKAIQNLRKGLYPKAFCKIVPDYLGGDPRFCNVMHADGAGTKSSLAYLYWKETGDISVWEGIAQDAVVMNLDDLICVGATNNILVSSTIGRNKKNIPGNVLTALINGTENFLQKMRDLGIHMVLTGGETADVGDLVKTVIVDSTVIARIPREEVISNDQISAGNLIVGLASFGQTIYENHYNSGIGSNGLTAARHDVLNKNYARSYPETFDASLEESIVYAGSGSVTDSIGGLPLNLGQLLLSPTRTYAPVVSKMLKTFRNHVKGMIHCSGGGQTKVLHFIDSLHVVKDDLFEPPPLFLHIQKESGAPWREMYQVFNMGHRFEVYLDDPVAADELIALCADFHLDAKQVGKVLPAENKKLTIYRPEGSIEYS
ncbi:MAG: phosphoribosylformylglycinamidine cyclo-ligase [Bacteroidia bacterium]|nr:MAG: phosphoribosylformylglycinamidine cyclo-ligase [Bacteroidia bacterium]